MDQRKDVWLEERSRVPLTLEHGLDPVYTFKARGTYRCHSFQDNGQLSQKFVICTERGGHCIVTQLTRLKEEFETRSINLPVCLQLVYYLPTYSVYVGFSREQTLRIFSQFTQGFREIFSISVPTNVLCLACDTRKRRLIGGGRSGLTLWKIDGSSSLITLTPEHTLHLPANEEDSWVRDILVCRSGKNYIIQCDDGVHVVDCNTDHVVRSIPITHVTCWTVIWQLGYLITAVGNGTIQVLRYENAVKIGEILGHTAKVTSLTLLSVPSLLLSSSLDQAICIWHLETLELLAKYTLNEAILGCQVITNSTELITWTQKGIQIWKLNMFYCLFAHVNSNILSLDQQETPGQTPNIICSAEDGAIRIISARTGRTMNIVYPLASVHPPRSVVYSAIWWRLWLLLKTGKVIVYDAGSNPCKPLCLLLSHDNEEIVCCLVGMNLKMSDNVYEFLMFGGLRTGVISLIESQNLTLRGPMKAHNGEVTMLQLVHKSPQTISDDKTMTTRDDLLVSCGTDHMVRIWGMKVSENLVTIRCIYQIFLRTIPVYMIVSDTVICVAVWNQAAANVIMYPWSCEQQSANQNPDPLYHSKEEDHTEKITGLTYLSLYDVFLSVGSDGSLKIWDSKNQLRRELILGKSLSGICPRGTQGNIVTGCRSYLLHIACKEYLPDDLKMASTRMWNNIENVAATPPIFQRESLFDFRLDNLRTWPVNLEKRRLQTEGHPTRGLNDDLVRWNKSPSSLHSSSQDNLNIPCLLSPQNSPLSIKTRHKLVEHTLPKSQEHSPIEKQRTASSANEAFGCSADIVISTQGSLTHSSVDSTSRQMTHFLPLRFLVDTHVPNSIIRRCMRYLMSGKITYLKQHWRKIMTGLTNDDRKASSTRTMGSAEYYKKLKRLYTRGAKRYKRPRKPKRSSKKTYGTSTVSSALRSTMVPEETESAYYMTVTTSDDHFPPLPEAIQKLVRSEWFREMCGKEEFHIDFDLFIDILEDIIEDSINPYIYKDICEAILQLKQEFPEDSTYLDQMLSILLSALQSPVQESSTLRLDSQTTLRTLSLLTNLGVFRPAISFIVASLLSDEEIIRVATLNYIKELDNLGLLESTDLLKLLQMCLKHSNLDKNVLCTLLRELKTRESMETIVEGISESAIGAIKDELKQNLKKGLSQRKNDAKVYCSLKAKKKLKERRQKVADNVVVKHEKSLKEKKVVTSEEEASVSLRQNEDYELTTVKSESVVALDTQMGKKSDIVIFRSDTQMGKKSDIVIFSSDTQILQKSMMESIKCVTETKTGGMENSTTDQVNGNEQETMTSSTGQATEIEQIIEFIRENKEEIMTSVTDSVTEIEEIIESVTENKEQSSTSLTDPVNDIEKIVGSAREEEEECFTSAPRATINKSKKKTNKQMKSNQKLKLEEQMKSQKKMKPKFRAQNKEESTLATLKKEGLKFRPQTEGSKNKPQKEGEPKLKIQTEEALEQKITHLHANINRILSGERHSEEILPLIYRHDVKYKQKYIADKIKGSDKQCNRSVEHRLQGLKVRGNGWRRKSYNKRNIVSSNKFNTFFCEEELQRKAESEDLITPASATHRDFQYMMRNLVSSHQCIVFSYDNYLGLQPNSVTSPCEKHTQTNKIALGIRRADVSLPRKVHLLSDDVKLRTPLYNRVDSTRKRGLFFERVLGPERVEGYTLRRIPKYSHEMDEILQTKETGTSVTKIKPITCEENEKQLDRRKILYEEEQRNDLCMLQIVRNKKQQGIQRVKIKSPKHYRLLSVQKDLEKQIPNRVVCTSKIRTFPYEANLEPVKNNSFLRKQTKSTYKIKNRQTEYKMKSEVVTSGKNRRDNHQEDIRLQQPVGNVLPLHENYPASQTTANWKTTVKNGNLPSDFNKLPPIKQRSTSRTPLSDSATAAWRDFLYLPAIQDKWKRKLDSAEVQNYWMKNKRHLSDANRRELEESLRIVPKKKVHRLPPMTGREVCRQLLRVKFIFEVEDTGKRLTCAAPLLVKKQKPHVL